MKLPKLTALNQAEFVASARRGERPDEYCILAKTPAFLKEFCDLLCLSQADLRNSGFIRLSAKTIYQHSSKHKEATAEAYLEIGRLMLKHGQWLNIPQETENGAIIERICAYVKHDGKLWKMGIHFSCFAEIYIATLFRSNKKNLSRDRAKAINIWE